MSRPPGETSPTEARNAATIDIDRLPVLDLLRRINDEDERVAGAVRGVLPQVATLVERALEAVRADRRVHYFGAGSSGRAGLVDAVELVPTFGIPPDLVIAHLAGGDEAIRVAVEGLEDEQAAGVADAADLIAGDVALGIAASGRTPYVAGALAHARGSGAFTALLTSNPAAPLAPLADLLICVDTGPEAIVGSTRMKAATAQKLVLNAFSTALMVRLGRTYSNLMISLRPTNEKLRERSIRLLVEATGEPAQRCQEVLGSVEGELSAALVRLISGVDPDRARAALAAADGRVSDALQWLGEATR
jgi:N-acetylmuramic acid 6-phosphate etherase